MRLVKVFLTFTIITGWACLINAQSDVKTIIGSPSTTVSKPVLTPKTEQSWKEYVSDEGGFKVLLPEEKPTKTAVKRELPFGETTVYRHLQVSISKNGAFFLDILHYDFPGAMNDPKAIEAAYLSGRDAMLNKTNMKLISEKTVVLAEFNGKEFTFEDGESKFLIRAFIAKNRFFQLSAVAPLANTTKGSNKIPINKIAETFFNSFKITKLPEAVESALLPKEFGDKLENNFYTNEFLAFSIALPKEWQIANKEEETARFETGKELMKNEKESFSLLLDSSQNNTKFLVLARKKRDTDLRELLLVIAAEKLPVANLSSFDMASISQKTQVNYMYLKSEAKPYTAKLGNVEFYAFDGIVEHPLGSYKQKMYVTVRKGIALEIGLFYLEEEELKAMEKLLQTINFK